MTYILIEDKSTYEYIVSVFIYLLLHVVIILIINVSNFLQMNLADSPQGRWWVEQRLRRGIQLLLGPRLSLRSWMMDTSGESMARKKLKVTPIQGTKPPQSYHGLCILFLVLLYLLKH